MGSNFPSINDLLKKDDDENVELEIKKEKHVGEFTPQEELVEKLQDIEIKDKEKIIEKQARGIGLQYIDLSKFPVSLDALRIIQKEKAEQAGVVCFFATPEDIRLGVVDPNEEVLELAEDLEKKQHAKVEVYLISENSFKRVIGLYKNLPIIKPVSKEINITEKDLAKYQDKIENLETLQKFFEDISITEILNLLIASSLKIKASDVHVEAEEQGIAVRYRIDGVLHDVAELPKETWKKFISRIKLLAGLKINITDKPQDGRVTLRLEKESLDVRVSTMPTVFGESVVMRILYGSDEGKEYDELGLRGAAYVTLKKEITRPNGMIVTTGPTGSGKTTTMYAILRTLNKPGVKIITLEDPVEIKMKGINQSQVDPSHDYTFAKGLRSLLRQDPDICMVGEIRDLETAEISVQAALTGHLMLSTIHTNEAAGVIPRFLSMGVKPFLLAPALNSVIGQRLVRRICEHCKVKDELDSEVLERVGEVLDTLPESEKNNLDFSNLQFFKGKGCSECSGLGYKGRIGIYEVFNMTKEIEENILSEKVSEYTIKELAIAGGMITMVQDGLLKVLDQITTVEEVFRVTK